jgi:hypothetical protein
MAMS